MIAAIVSTPVGGPRQSAVSGPRAIGHWRLYARGAFGAVGEMRRTAQTTLHDAVLKQRRDCGRKAVHAKCVRD
jgi:hypothetical protein